MYQGNVRPSWDRTMAEAIRGFLEGRRWWRSGLSEVLNNGCFVHLGRCDIVIWHLIAHYYYWDAMTGVRPPAILHCYWVHDTSTRLLYVPHVGEDKIHESERWWRSTRHGLVFAASRDPFIQSRTKKSEGGSFPARQARKFGIVCSRQRGRKGNKQIKVERLSFGKIWFYGVRTHYGGSILWVLTTPSFPVYRARLKNLFSHFIRLVIVGVT